MLIHILSDLHLEFGPMPAGFDPRTLGADLHLLAGDIGSDDLGAQWAARSFSAPAAYVFGNHEHYGNRTMEAGLASASQLLAETSVRVLECQEMHVPGARVLGCTLWTDFELMSPDERDSSMAYALGRMNDYRHICVGYAEEIDENGPPRANALDGTKLASNPSQPFSPKLALAKHISSLAWLHARLAEPFEGRTVVLTHHAPHAKSLLYEQPVSPLDPAYASDLSVLLDSARIDLWVHGHTHVPCDYRQGRARVVSNPRGYAPSALVDGFDPGLLIEI